ncbi:MAG: hypothetical protein KF753_19785 [Caldilineaceae bacterium]|nr:hypothetical protein [Caldilineaceae bacterium]
MKDISAETTDDCCAVPPVQGRGTKQSCPVCGAKGKNVDTQTVKAMLAVSLDSLTSRAYRFCPTQSCEVVYFGERGDVYTEDDLRERVHQKHPDAADVFVCYCFRHTPGSIQRELRLTGTSTVVEQINAGIRAGQCACEIRNPQGSCCLGNVIATVKRVQRGTLLFH